MRLSLRLFFVIVVFLRQLSLPQQGVWAQTNLPEQVAVILILDNSGSMRTSDPDNLRFTAARLFIALLDQGDAVGMIRFSTSSQPLTDGVMLLENPEQKKQLTQLFAPVPPDGYTDIKSALQDTAAMLASGDLRQRETIIILLTDGKPEIPQPYPEYETETLAVGRSLGVPVLSIALTSAAQTPFLTRLAVETGGSVLPADQASDLLDAYLEIFGQLKDRSVLGSGTTAVPGQIELEVEPSLAPYIERISFIAVKPANAEIELMTPDGQVVTLDDPSLDFSMTEDDRFIVLTLTQPPGGEWQLNVQGNRGVALGRAVIRSRLRAAVISPVGYFEAGQPVLIVANLVEDQEDGLPIKIVGEARFSALITRPDGSRESLDRLYDDGTHGDLRAGDGNFSRAYVNTDLEGVYLVRVTGSKGLIPVEKIGRFETIVIPQFVVDQPNEDSYDIREQAVEFEVHLEGGRQSLLDQGELLAIVTSPSGKVQSVLLEQRENHYLGAFLPTEDGVYQVLFIPKDASYQGIPYRYQAKVSFEARIIHNVRNLTEDINLGRIEVLQAEQGFELTLDFESDSPHAEPVQIELRDFTGYMLKKTEEWTIPASGKATFRILLAPTGEVQPGKYNGRLIFSTRNGVDLVGASVNLELEVFQPRLIFSPSSIDLGSPATCRQWKAEFPLMVESSSRKVETVSFSLDAANLLLQPTSFEVSPGKQEITFGITPTQKLAAGAYKLMMAISTRQGVEISPADEISLQFTYLPFWSRCRTPLTWGGVGLFLIAIGIGWGMRILRTTTAQPLVTGTLQHWPVGRRSESQDFDLTALKKSSVTIGRGSDCDLSLSDPTLEMKHALLKAESEVDKIQIVLMPLEGVRIGYRPLTGATPLAHQDIFTMGEREFQYLSDTGE